MDWINMLQTDDRDGEKNDVANLNCYWQQGIGALQYWSWNAKRNCLLNTWLAIKFGNKKKKKPQRKGLQKPSETETYWGLGSKRWQESPHRSGIVNSLRGVFQVRGLVPIELLYKEVYHLLQINLPRCVTKGHTWTPPRSWVIATKMFVLQWELVQDDFI